jgi:hypothetical protein
VSGYLTRLVDRAVGPPTAAVSPRVGPVFPVRPSGIGNEPAPAEVGVADVRAPRPAGSILAGYDAILHNDPVPGGRPRQEAEAETAGRHGPASRQAAPPAGRLRDDRPVEAMPATRPRSADPVETPAGEATSGPSVRAHDVRVEVRAELADATPREGSVAREGGRVQPVAALPRGAPRELPSRQGSGQPSRERAPRIEVRIGRVEIRRPSPPDRVEWPAPAPVAGAPVVTGFGELAAARRYVDRRWS